MVARLLVWGVLGILVGCGETLKPTEFPVVETEALSGAEGLAGVDYIRVSEASKEALYVIFGFERPVSAETVEGRLRVVSVPGQDGLRISLGSSREPDESFGWQWNSTGSRVTVRIPKPPGGIWRAVVDAGVIDRLGRPIDGTRAVRIVEPQNLARISDDGYASASSHISLPFYAEGQAGLSDHPRLRLHHDRPRVQLEVYAAATSTPMLTLQQDGASAVLADLPQRIVVRMRDLHGRLASDTTVERDEPFFFASDAPDYVELRDADGVTMPVTFSLDGGATDFQQPFRVTMATTQGFLGLSGLGEWAYDGTLAVLRANDRNDVLLFKYGTPTTGGLQFPPYIATGSATAIPGSLLAEDKQAAWRKGELVLLTFRAGGFSGVIDANEANTMTISQSVVGCAPACDYVVENDPSLQFQLDQQVYVLGSALSARVDDALGVHPLPWTVWVKGGFGGAADAYGVPIWDGIRDGDELAQRIDDTVRFTLQPSDVGTSAVVQFKQAAFE